MADIELVIKIPEEEYINIKNATNSLIENGVERASMSKVCLAILDGTPLPKRSTNGDVIKAVFPNAKTERGLYGIDGIPLICLNLGTRHDVHEMSFVEDWWNAPYKRESEE